MSKASKKVIGIDLGATKVRAGEVVQGKIEKSARELLPHNGSELAVLEVIYSVIEAVLKPSTESIGVGVPSVVDVEKGIVYDVQNIPSWREVPLKSILEDRYGLPVFLNNDANCFALGEKTFGLGRQYSSMIGLIVGTGLACGIIIDDVLYNGPHCGAGEFGIIPYLDHCYEYYACGQFFTNVYQKDGAAVYQAALKGDKDALNMYAEMGFHLGNAVVVMLYALDPEVIILGGSVSKAYPFFKKTLWERIQTVVYRQVVEDLRIYVSEDTDLPVLGAAALCLQP